MAADLPPNLVGSPAHSEVRYAREQDKQRIKREEERKRAQAADMRLRSQQTSQKK